jgi:hypothetical protein
MSMNIVSGPYRHYKGGVYLLLCVAETHQHNGDWDTVYWSLEFKAWRTRPFVTDSRRQDAWCDLVTWPDGKMRDRFCPESEELAAIFPKDVQ